MKKLNKFENNNIFTFSLLLIIAVMVLSLCFFNNDLVFAEDTDTILNFNQLSKNINVSISFNSGGNSEGGLYYQNASTSSGEFTASNMGFSNLDSSHKYYYKMLITNYSSNVSHMRFYFNSYAKTIFVYPQGNGNYYGIVSGLTSYNLPRLYKTDTAAATYTITWQFIDLSIMYGIGNEPTLQQCLETFTAEYYRYTEGTPINITQLNYNSGYEQGFNDGYTSFTTQPIFTNSLNNVSNGTSAIQNTINSYYNSDGSITYTNVGETYVSLLLDEPLQYQYRYEVSWDNIYCQENGEFIIDFEYVLSDGSSDLVNDSFKTNSSGSFSFYYNESSTTNTFTYFTIRINDTTSSNLKFTILNLKITKETDLTTTYNNGVRDGKSEGYKEGYSNGYLKGYNVGFNEGYSRDTTNLVSTFWTWFSDMFTNIGQIFEVELFSGITVGAVILVPLLFSVLILVLKLIRG